MPNLYAEEIVFPTHTPFEWNMLDEDTRNSVSIGEFKRKLLVQIRLPCKSVYNVHNVTGVRNLTRLRVGFSPLNEHRIRHDILAFDRYI